MSLSTKLRELAVRLAAGERIDYLILMDYCLALEDEAKALEAERAALEQERNNLAKDLRRAILRGAGLDEPGGES